MSLSFGALSFCTKVLVDFPKYDAEACPAIESPIKHIFGFPLRVGLLSVCMYQPARLSDLLPATSSICLVSSWLGLVCFGHISFLILFGVGIPSNYFYKGYFGIINIITVIVIVILVHWWLPSWNYGSPALIGVIQKARFLEPFQHSSPLL